MVVLPSPLAEEMPYTSAAHRKARTKAPNTVVSWVVPMKLRPKTITTAAPIAAALERPVVKGLAIVLPVMACITSPLTASPIPASSAITIRGSRRWSRTVSSVPLRGWAWRAREGKAVASSRAGVTSATPAKQLTTKATSVAAATAAAKSALSRR